MVAFPNPRSRHPFHMHAMIRGQPAFIAETLRRVDAANPESFLGKPRRLFVTGCGTSFHAATYGARVLQEAFPFHPIIAAHAYDLAYGGSAPSDATVLGVSHSGSTPTTNRALHRARRRGCRTIAICGLSATEMAAEADAVLVIGSTHDRSWANTMSYTTQLTAFAALGARGGGHVGNAIGPSLGRLPQSIEKTLACEPRMRWLAAAVARRSRVTILGSGLDEVTAVEAALKIRETCSLPASGYHTEQVLHGPCLSVDRRESVVMLRSRDDGARSEAIRKSMVRFGARVTTIGDAPDANIRLPSTERVLRPIVSVVPLQFLAYYAALERRANPDIMRTDIPRYRAGLEPLFH